MPELKINIGTRDSQLAQWQSNLVASLLQKSGHETELVLIKSEGDINLVTPLYEMGVQGIFTKTLDAALLEGRIDLAVHSYKDVPTKLARGLKVAAVVDRGNPKDLLVFKDEASKEKYLRGQNGRDANFIISTSSSRRKAQWLNRFPLSKIENLRGNVNTRLKKLYESGWDGAIFAAAGLERLEIKGLLCISLDWMLPAPAQGAIVVVGREEDTHVIEACQAFNHCQTAMATQIEKDFLRELMGGCSTPIGAYARVSGDNIIFQGNILSPDGRLKKSIEITEPLDDHAGLGLRSARKLLDHEGLAILSSFNKKMTDGE